MRRNADNIILESEADCKLVVSWVVDYQSTERFPLADDQDTRLLLRQDFYALIGVPTPIQRFIDIVADFDVWGRGDNKAEFIGKLWLCGAK